MAYKVREVAEIAGISVRTLHHYHRIGLLAPEEITPSGYRLYSDRELERLQQILFFKEIGFSLPDIREILDSPGFDRQSALRSHRELLSLKRQRLDDLINTLESTIQSMEGVKKMSQKSMFEGFETNPLEEHKRKYAAEARQKYGEKVVAASEQRVSGYSQEDWTRVMQEWEAIYERIIPRIEHGPSDPQVQAALDDLRQLFCQNFYDCTPEIFRGLGNLYVEDPRFTANIDKYQEGLAAFLQQAMQLYQA